MKSVSYGTFGEMRCNVVSRGLFEEYLAALDADEVSLPRSRLQGKAAVIDWNMIEELRTLVARQNLLTALDHRL